MIKKIAFFLPLSIFVISLSGCATSRKTSELENQGLRNQITVLETQLQTKEDEISSLRESLARQEQEKQAQAVKETGKKQGALEAKSRPGAKQIQAALRNAGFDPGNVDGKMGNKTREAIKAFQKGNNLQADGKVGKATWNLLKEYLNKKIK